MVTDLLSHCTEGNRGPEKGTVMLKITQQTGESSGRPGQPLLTLVRCRGVVLEDLLGWKEGLPGHF